MTKDEVLKLALDALEELNNTNSHWWQEVDEEVVVQLGNAEEAIKEALAQPEQEPFGYLSIGDSPIFQKEKPEIGRWETLYTTPPQRTWVGLTEEEHTELAIECGCLSADWVFYGAALERKIKEKNEI